MSAPLHVSLLAFPDAFVSTITGVFDVLNSFQMLAGHDGMPPSPPFRVDIVAELAGPVDLASGMPVVANRSIDEVAATDIIIVPSVMVQDSWDPGRYPALVDWLQRMHAQGAVLCSACSGVFLLAETGLLDRCDTTVHYDYAAIFAAAFPGIHLEAEQVLVVSGQDAEFVMSGAATTWHDLTLYLIARFVGTGAAQSVARFFAIQWHVDSLTPYMVFDPPMDHGDGVIGDIQVWLKENSAIGNPVQQMVAQSGLPERSFKRRFSKATGQSPINYVQRLRIERAKRLLEREHMSIDEISWRVGYEDASAFRRLFKKLAGVTAGAYRRKFQLPSHISADS